MNDLWMIYKSSLRGDFPPFSESFKIDSCKFEHPTANRIGWSEMGCFTQWVQPNNIRIHAYVSDKEIVSNMSTYNMYLKSERFGIIPATRKQVMACLPNVGYTRISLDDSGFINAAIFNLTKSSISTVDGEINIENIPGVIKYRPHRELLEDAMAEEKTFSTVDEMFTFITNDWNNSFTFHGKHLFDKSDIIISSHAVRDDRIEWLASRGICVTRMGDEIYDTPQCIGFCSFE